MIGNWGWVFEEGKKEIGVRFGGEGNGKGGFHGWGGVGRREVC